MGTIAHSELCQPMSVDLPNIGHDGFTQSKRVLDRQALAAGASLRVKLRRPASLVIT